jgi:hypothetical protein
MWMSRKFFLLPGIFPPKIENHFQKMSQKNCAERVLDLLLAPARTVASPDVSHVRFSAIIDSRPHFRFAAINGHRRASE